MRRNPGKKHHHKKKHRAKAKVVRRRVAFQPVRSRRTFHPAKPTFQPKRTKRHLATAKRRKKRASKAARRSNGHLGIGSFLRKRMPARKHPVNYAALRVGSRIQVLAVSGGGLRKVGTFSSKGLRKWAQRKNIRLR